MTLASDLLKSSVDDLLPEPWRYIPDDSAPNFDGETQLGIFPLFAKH